MLRPLKNSIVHVRVTQKDIDSGKPGESCFCPLALATTRALRAKLRRHPTVIASVGITGITVMESLHGRGRYVPQLGPVLQFRRDFDGRRSVEPFEFDLDLEPVGGQVHVSQLRRWKTVPNGEGVNGLVFRVTKIGPAWAHGEYVSTTENTTRGTPTCAPPDWMAAHSAVVS